MALSKKNLSILIFAFVTVFFDTMNYALIVPILPYLVKELGSNSFQEGILFSSYSIFQLISIDILWFFIRSSYYGPDEWSIWKKTIFTIVFIRLLFWYEWRIWIMTFRIYISRNVSRYVEFDYLEIIYWIVCWISHSRSSVRIMKNY